MKFASWLGLIVLGVVVTAMIDSYLGIDLRKTVGAQRALLHEMTYVIWGGVLFNLGKSLRSE